MDLIFLALNTLATAVFWLTIIAAGLFFLRVMATWVGANPFGRVTYNLTRITEPFVRPLRHQFGVARMRYDLLPLVMGVMILFTGLFISSIISQLSGILYEIARTALYGVITVRFLMRELIILAGTLYLVAIFLRFLLPFLGVGYSSKFYRLIFAITEPLLKPLRRIFIAGMFDFSPLVAMLLVQILTSVLASALG